MIAPWPLGWPVPTPNKANAIASQGRRGTAQKVDDLREAVATETEASLPLIWDRPQILER
jgi:hypothetical protein